jgi:hypothetical protein
MQQFSMPFFNLNFLMPIKVLESKLMLTFIVLHEFKNSKWFEFFATDFGHWVKPKSAT